MTNKPTPEDTASLIALTLGGLQGGEIGLDRATVEIEYILSQQLTAFSEDVDWVLTSYELEGLPYPKQGLNDVALHRNQLRAEQRQALSNLKQKWGIE